MPQDLARWALLVWVQDKTRPRHGQRSKVSLSVLHCGAKSTLPHTCPPDRTLTHSATMGKVIAIPIQDGEELTCSPMESSPAVAPSSATCLAPSTSIGPDPRGARADLPGPTPAPAPMEPTNPLFPAGCLGEEGPAPAPPLSLHPAYTKRPPPPPSSSSMALSLAAEGASPKLYNHSGESGYGTCAWHPELSTGCPTLR